jgi:DNA-directed RNA polymerase subunit K/omega
VIRPDDVNQFEFIVMAAQRTAQLMRGCLPRVAGASHKLTTIAQSEVALKKVSRAESAVPAAEG